MFLLVLIIVSSSLVGCGLDESTRLSGTTENGTVLAFDVKFYDNDGIQWLEAQGNEFKITPNKIKTYSYSSSGDWVSSYETSSIVNISIDGSMINSCGSTAIFSDTRLKPCDIKFSNPLRADTTSDDATIVSGSANLSAYYWLDLQAWWSTQPTVASRDGSKLIVIQSQTGQPISMYRGTDVSWDIPNLPKTTRVTIDGKALYIHRSNFTIIDTALLSK